MAVLLTISKTLNGSAVNDSLAGGGTGVDFGTVINGAYAPIIDKDSNTGALNLYIRHNATVDPITDVKTFVQQYGVGTGFTYGGARTASSDLTDLLNLGSASGNSKNNADGTSGGLWVDMNAFSSSTTQFDVANYPNVVKIYGKSNAGINLTNAIVIHENAMVYDNSGTETAASSPIAGVIGKANDTTKGDNAHLKYRIYIPSTFAEGGIYQWELVIAYSYTA